MFDEYYLFRFFYGGFNLHTVDYKYVHKLVIFNRLKMEKITSLVYVEATEKCIRLNISSS